MTRYRHTQVGWALIVALILPVALLVVIAVVSRAWLPVAWILPLLVVLPMMSSLTVEVSDETVGLRFGLGLIRRRIALAEIASIAAADSPWRRGWGIRTIPGGRLYSVSGREIVDLLLVDGRRVQIGTDDRDGLMSALRDALGAVTPDLIARPTRDRTLTAVALLVAVILVTATGALTLAVRPIAVTTSGDGISIRGGGYSARILRDDVVRVHLDDRLPLIGWRTNGVAFRGRLRGHFRLADGRTAQLFVTQSRPPFITVETRTEPIIFNLDDAAQTRALYARVTRPVR